MVVDGRTPFPLRCESQQCGAPSPSLRRTYLAVPQCRPPGRGRRLGPLGAVGAVRCGAMPSSRAAPAAPALRRPRCHGDARRWPRVNRHAHAGPEVGAEMSHNAAHGSQCGLEPSSPQGRGGSYAFSSPSEQDS